MTISEAIDSQGYDEPATVQPARLDLAAIAANIARVRGHARDEDCHLLRMCGVPTLGDNCEALLAEVARLTKERDEARQLVRACLRTLDVETERDAGAAVRRWDAQAEVKP